MVRSEVFLLYFPSIGVVFIEICPARRDPVYRHRAVKSSMDYTLTTYTSSIVLPGANFSYHYCYRRDTSRIPQIATGGHARSRDQARNTSRS